MLEDEFQNKKSQMRWDLRENNQVLVKTTANWGFFEPEEDVL